MRNTNKNRHNSTLEKPECFSIIVCSKNNEKTIMKSLLASLNSAEHVKAKMGNIGYEVIVVYAPSKDNTLKLIKKAAQAMINHNIPVRVLFDEGKGLGYARQLGLINAKCPIVIYADADKALTKEWIHKAITNLIGDPLLAGTTDMPFIYGKSFLAKIRNGYILAYYVSYSLMKKLFKVESLAVVRAGNSAWKRDLALKVGGFPIWLRRAAEDYYLSKLLIENGFKLDMFDAISLQLEDHDIKSLVTIFRSQGMEAALKQVKPLRKELQYRAALNQRLLTPLMLALYPAIVLRILGKAFELKVYNLVGIVGTLLWPIFLLMYKTILFLTYIIYKSWSTK